MEEEKEEEEASTFKHPRETSLFRFVENDYFWHGFLLF